SYYLGYGSTKFTMASGIVSWAPGDTSPRTITVAFASTANDTSRNGVVLHDNFNSDTVWTTGFDTNYIRPVTKDFWLYSHFDYLYNPNDSVSTLIYNYQSSSITLLATLSD